MVNLCLVKFEAQWILTARAFYCFIIFFIGEWTLTPQKKTNKLGEYSPNFIFVAMNLDPIGIEKRWTNGESWPNDFVEKVNRGEDLRWVGSRCPLAGVFSSSLKKNEFILEQSILSWHNLIFVCKQQKNTPFKGLLIIFCLTISTKPVWPSGLVFVSQPINQCAHSPCRIKSH